MPQSHYFRVLVGSTRTLSITHIFAIVCSRGFDKSGERGNALRAEGSLLNPSRERQRATSSEWYYGAMNTGLTSLCNRKNSHGHRIWCLRPPLFPSELVARWRSRL